MGATLENYIDWKPILKYIPNKKDKTILELGCGFGTQFLVNEFKYVYSFETNSKDKKGIWFKKTQEQYKNKNWKGVFSNKFPWNKSKPGHINSLDEFYDEVNKFINLSEIDVVFVDPGFFQRAECVKYFASKDIEYIFVHDVNLAPEIYKWHLLDDIKEKYLLSGEITEGMGTKLFKLI